MAIYIQKLYVQSFRGIRELRAEHLNHINLIVGDNNCGKTSVLEAVLLLRDPSDFSNILRVARLRDQDRSLFAGQVSAYESFCNLFSQGRVYDQRRVDPCPFGQQRYAPVKPKFSFA